MYTNFFLYKFSQIKYIRNIATFNEMKVGTVITVITFTTTLQNLCKSWKINFKIVIWYMLFCSFFHFIFCNFFKIPNILTPKSLHLTLFSLHRYMLFTFLRKMIYIISCVLHRICMFCEFLKNYKKGAKLPDYSRWLQG